MSNFTSPIHVELPRKTVKNKKIHLGLNWYRNAKHFESNQAKQIYKELMREQLEGKVYSPPVKITYTYFATDKRLSDVDNKCSVVNKFFQDALVEFGCIPEDNYTIVPKISYEFGGVDKGNGRVEICIEELTNA